MTRTLRLTIAYDGTNYAGWQVQRASQPTIQGTLERVLGRILRERASVVGSGRTDAGVHALAQIAHVRTHSAIPCERLQRALNGLLPLEIRVREIRDASEHFHAQFDVVSKRYRYQIATEPVVLPHEARYVHHVREPLNVSLMRREAQALRGRHDMRAFQKTGSPVRDTRRHIVDIQVRRCGHLLLIELEADGFLYGMVRRIVGTLIDIGRGHRPPRTMARILKMRDRRLVGPTAPAKGLCLVEVMYDGWLTKVGGLC